MQLLRVYIAPSDTNAGHVHAWEKEWKQSDNFHRKCGEGRIVPWTTQVHCQRFFASRAGSRWVEVRASGAEQEEGEERAEEGEDEEQMDPRKLLEQYHDRYHQRLKEAEREATIQEVNEKAEANAWLGRVGWSRHLAKLDVKKLRATMEAPTEEESVLQEICASLTEMRDWGQVDPA